MNLNFLKTEITIIGGRPGTGKSSTARNYAETLIRQKKHVIYYHAEGPVDLHESDFEFLGPDDTNFLDYIPDIYMTKEDLLARMASLPDRKESLIVVDTIELFDCEPHDLIASLRQRVKDTPARVLILANLPRKFESKPKDCAEDFLRRKFAFTDDEIIVLGDFPLE